MLFSILIGLTMNICKFNQTFCLSYYLIEDIFKQFTHTFHGKTVGKEITINHIINTFFDNKQEDKNVIFKKEISNNIDKDMVCLFKKCNGRSFNDSNNKMRENIIYSIINHEIPDEWYNESKWNELRIELYNYINKYHPGKGDYKCVKMAGRKYNYDFKIFNGELLYKNEFKFNAKSITDIPQILSLSSNFNTNYSEYFYDNYVLEISQLYGVDILEKNDYLKNVHQTQYHKHVWFHHIYKNEKEKINEKKELVDKSIHEYLQLICIENKDSFNLQKITKKLKETQLNKHFMLYDTNTNKFYYDKINENECIIKDIHSLKLNQKKKYYNTMILNTNIEKTKLHMLLRWRNHYGILNPAWQIKIVRMKI